MKLGSLFSGIGGLDLGLERTLGCEIEWACEADSHCRGVLAARWPEAALHDDVRGLVPAPCDVICGGFPCQDISLAGKGAGLAGERSGLWYEMLRVVGIVRPMFVVIENVGALVKRGLATVAEGLAGLGYAVEWQTITALSVGALHIRSRVFVVAHRMANVGVFRDPGVVERTFAAHRAPGGIWAAEPAGVPRTVTRAQMAPSVRRSRLKALGNAVVPQVAEVVGACLRGAIDAPRAPVGWRAIGVVTDGEARTAPDLFGATAPVAMPACGALVHGTLYETRPLCDLRTAKARHAAVPGPFSLPMPTPTAGDANSSGSRNTAASAAHPGVSLTDAIRGDDGMGRRTTVPTPTAKLGDARRGAPSASVGADRLRSGRSNLDDAVASGIIPTPQGYAKGKPENSEPGLAPLDIAVRGMYGRTGLLPTPRLNRGPSMDAKHASLDGIVGLLPTPTATEYGSSQNGVNGLGGENERPSARTPSLSTMARRGLGPLGVVPTRRASDWRSGRTSAATRERNSRPLCEVVMAAQDADRRVRIHRRRAAPMLGVRAVRVVRDAAHAPPTGHLNPGWVEWLMGFPAGWFDVAAMVQESTAAPPPERMVEDDPLPW